MKFQTFHLSLLNVFAVIILRLFVRLFLYIHVCFLLFARRPSLTFRPRPLQGLKIRFNCVYKTVGETFGRAISAHSPFFFFFFFNKRENNSLPNHRFKPVNFLPLVSVYFYFYFFWRHSHLWLGELQSSSVGGATQAQSSGGLRVRRGQGREGNTPTGSLCYILLSIICHFWFFC